MMLTSEQKSFFAEHGWLLAPGLAPVSALGACTDRIEAILSGEEKVHHFVRYGAGGKPIFYRMPQLAQREKAFDALARQAAVFSAVQDLVGPAQVFRDIVVAKPPKDGGEVVYHQDAAYWDVMDRNRSVSAWIALDDVPKESGCLQFVDGSHKELVRHDIYFRGWKLPDWMTRSLRSAVSLTGTGDNPKSAVERAFWKLKDLVLGKASKIFPSINDLNWLRADPRVAPGKEVFVPVKKGDVIFFHGLLLHASGPNVSPNPRRAYIVTYAGI